jgi:hypothetical protein
VLRDHAECHRWPGWLTHSSRGCASSVTRIRYILEATMLRRAVLSLLAPAAVFFVARWFLGNGDALLVAALVYAQAEARRRCRSFQSAQVVSSQSREWPSSQAMRAKA